MASTAGRGLNVTDANECCEQLAADVTCCGVRVSEVQGKERQGETHHEGMKRAEERRAWVERASRSASCNA
jgi:hypothetical protein